MDWWDAFSLKEFFLTPMKYVPPEIDSWIREWGNFIDTFVAKNPWFCTFLSGTGMAWLTWFVTHTPWKWDDKLPDWISSRIFKKDKPSPAPASGPAPTPAQEISIKEEKKK